MNHCTKILSVLILLTCSCSDSSRIDNDIETRAIELQKNVDTVSLNTFKEWSFFPRGRTGIWSKISADSTLFSCIYSVEKDTEILTFFRPTNFIRDFPFKDSFDFTKYYRFDLLSYNDMVNITAIDTHGQKHNLGVCFREDSLFKSASPFDKLRQLSALKAQLGFIATSYRSDIGNFIQFYMTPNHILTYIPDSLILNPKYKDYWLNDFSSGKTINVHWNFRKSERPLDNG